MTSPNLDIPAVHRQQRMMAGGGGAFPLGLDDDIINIPAFLRHQND
jgi:cell division protein FtsZ